MHAIHWRSTDLSESLSTHLWPLCRCLGNEYMPAIVGCVRGCSFLTAIRIDSNNFDDVGLGSLLITLRDLKVGAARPILPTYLPALRRIARKRSLLRLRLNAWLRPGRAARGCRAPE